MLYSDFHTLVLNKNGSKEILYLTSHSKHFHLWLYDVGHMVKDQLDSKRGNQLPQLHGLLVLIRSKSSFICTIPQTG